MRTVLTIAGLDSSGGAGLAADVATITRLGLHAKAVVTAITAQSLQGVQRVQPLDPALVYDQIDCAFKDVRPDAVKVGMLANNEVAASVAHALRDAGATNVVVDPVLRSTSGTSLMELDSQRQVDSSYCESGTNSSARVDESPSHSSPRQMRRNSCVHTDEGLRELLFLCRLATPNVPESLQLCGARGTRISIGGEDHFASARSAYRVNDEPGGCAELEHIARTLASEFGCAFLVKGGHLGIARDCLAWPDGAHGFKSAWVGVPPVPGAQAHGTGCALSSAIACGLALGMDLQQAVLLAKRFLRNALAVRQEFGSTAYLGIPWANVPER